MSPHKKSGSLRPVSKKRITGLIQITRRGMGYVPWGPEKASPVGQAWPREDIEVRTEDLNGALNGDTVEVELIGFSSPRRAEPSGRSRPKGKVVSVTSRAKEEFVATLQKKAGALLAIPDDKKFYRPITLSTIPPYDEGEKVLVRLISFTGKQDPVGTVIEHLGRAGEHRVEMNAIVLAHGFRTNFPEEVLREAKLLESNHAKIIEEEAPKRADYRSVTTFTIDPADAKDFDDALSIKELDPPAGGGEPIYEIGIHIADATFFVRPNTPLGEEVQKRGTSVYLVDTTIPMLPHELSGNVCSLKEGEDRLTFSAVFTMDRDGRVLDRRFEKSIICSNKRFTYEEAQEVLNTGKGPFVQELGTLRALSRTLRTKREKEGAIDFGDNEVKFVLDPDGKPLSVVRKERLETMQLIEEFMLLANKEVAQHISKLAQKVPESKMVFLYRIHDAPKEDRIEELAIFVRAIGFEFGNPKRKKYSARDIAHLLKQIEGKPEEHLIRTATLRSMAKAIYSTKNIGHFGLAFEYYTHFTSPIRRYPDMLVHRILASHLDSKPLTQKEFGDLEKLCIAASAREAEAVEAERESIRYKQVEYMSSKIGQTFEGVISGVTDWGLYVEEKESASEGLVPVRTIGDDFYSYNQKEYSLVGQRTKKKYALGDPVRVKLVAADLAARQLEFQLV